MPAGARIAVIRPGMLTTVQDLGRWGLQNHGVPVAGPMDRWSHRLANRLVGNVPEAATLEITLGGPELELRGEIIFAVAGAEFDIRLDGDAVPPNTTWRGRAGARLRIARPSRGARAYLAVAGGIDVLPVLGSRATHLVSRMGGLLGRALAAGDVLDVGTLQAERARIGQRREPLFTLPQGGSRVRVLLGPQADLFTDEALEVVRTARYRITPQSNRMGYRLDGPPLERRDRRDIISDATPLGVLQVPASGQPILLTADCQTTGGYPKIATVITADLPCAGQLGPGDWIEFQPCERREAMAALIAYERRLMAD